MKIGLISDTHGFLDDKVFEHFKNCDEIWHAGDLGTVEVLEKLKSFKPLVVVYGNIDSGPIRQLSEETIQKDINGKKLLMTHIGAAPPRYNRQIRDLLEKEKPDVFICGHSHICKVQYDPKRKVLYMNPGAAGRHGFHKLRTLLRFEIENSGKLKDLEVVELGSRSRLA